MHNANGRGDRRRARLRIAVGVLVVVAGALLPAATAAAGTVRSGTYKGPEGSQQYELYIPASYRAGTPAPLVVALHGCTQTADQFRLLTRWDVQADAHGFIVLLPQQDSSANSFKCWNFFQDGSMHRGAGDPARIAAVTSLIENSYNIDPHRVYATGMSAGGAMASILGATYPDYFAAIGTGSGCEYAATAACAGYKSADPNTAGHQAYREMGPRARPIPFIAFQGDADTTVPPANADQLVQQWLLTDDLADDGVANGSVPSRPAKTSASYAQAGRYSTIRTYVDSRKAELGAYWLVHGMKHAWSGGNGSQQFSDPSGPNASAAMYAFFASHPAPSLRRPAPPRGMRKSGGPALSNARKRGAPKVSRLKLSRGRIVFRISGAGLVTLRLQRRVAGHLSRGDCVAGKGKGRRCMTYTTRAMIVRMAAKAGRISIALPKRVRGHRLARGSYRILVTPTAAGRTGRSRRLALSMRRGPQGTAARWARR